MNFLDWGFQKEAVKKAGEFFFGSRKGKRLLLSAPTGSGKTFMSSDFLRTFMKKDETALFIVNRQTLVGQSYDTLGAVNLKAAVLHNTLTKTIDDVVMSTDFENADVIITLVETLENNIEILPENFDPAYICIDEAHKATSQLYQDLVERYPNALILGLSATPKRPINKPGEHLSEFYDELLTTVSVKELIRLKALAEPHYIKLDKDAHVVNSWLTLTAIHPINRRTIIFTRNTNHSQELKDSFLAAGIAAEMITSGSELVEEAKNQTPNQRNKIFRQFRDGEIEVLISCGAIAEGFDEKLAMYCFIPREIGNISLFHQVCGRVLRYYDEAIKPYGMIVDFGGNIEKYGPLEDYVWTLDDPDTINNATKIVDAGGKIKISEIENKKLYVRCHDCNYVYDYNEHEVCFHCSCSTNHIEVSSRVDKVREYLIGQVGVHAWAHLCAHPSVKTEKDAFWKIVEILNRCINNHEHRARFNVMYFEAFEPGTLNLMHKFSWMKDLHEKKKKLKMTDTIQFEI